MYFTNAYSHSSWTAPAFKALFTSKYPLSLGGQLNISSFENIPKMLQKRNYDTVALLYGNNDFVGKLFGYDQIFNKYIVYDIYNSTFKNKHIHKKAKDLAFTIRDYVPSAYYTYLLFNALSIPEDNKNRFFKLFKNSLESPQNKNKFVWTHLMDVHEPYYPEDINRKNLLEKVKAWYKNVPMLPKGKEKSGSKGYRLQKADQLIGIIMEELLGEKLKDITPEDSIPWLKKWYAQRVKIAIDKIKSMMDIFYEERGEGLVIITADHGQAFGEHGYVGHCINLHQELIKIPIVIIDGDIKGTSSKMISHGDLFAIIAGKIGEEENIKGEIIGKNILKDNIKRKVVIAETAENRKEDIHQVIKTRKMLWEKRKIAVVTEKWKYIKDYSNNTEEMYDLSKDPQEKTNLINDPPEEIEDLRLMAEYHMNMLSKERRLLLKAKELAHHR